MRAWTFGFVAALVAAGPACGYRPLRSSLQGGRAGQGAPRIVVAGAHARVPGGAAMGLPEEAASGARAELARFGALGRDEDAKADRLTLEIVRLDEASAGVAAAGDLPTARGVRIRVAARASVQGPEGSFETEDVEATEVVSSAVSSGALGAGPEADALGWDARRAAAVRMLARRVGAKLARQVLGIP